MKSFISHTAYAIINFFEACVVMLTLGYYNPDWTVDYLCWNGKRKATKRKKGSLK